jgi:anti-anti-sigma regulatory factor
MTATLVDQLQLGDHVCAFVEGTDDRLDAMAAMVTAGLDAGDRVLVFTESLPPVEVLTGLHARGVPVQPAERAGQVRVLSAREAYLRAGRFEPQRMLAWMVGHVERAGAEGYQGLRVLGDMAWALDEPAGVERLAWYEAQVNRIYLDGRAMAVCLYDRRTSDRELLRRVSSAHPSTTVVGADHGWVPLLRIRRTGHPYGLRLVGEADLTNRSALAAALDAAVDEQPDPGAPIVVDCSGLRFADGSSAALLCRLALKAPAGVHLTGCHGAVAVVLDRLGAAKLPGVRLSPGDAGDGETEVVP